MIYKFNYHSDNFEFVLKSLIIIIILFYTTTTTTATAAAVLNLDKSKI